MKKFLKLMLLVLVALFLVSCGGGEIEEKPTENAAEKAKEYLGSLEIVYAEGESASAVKSDITLKGVEAEGVTITWTSDNDAVVINGNKGTVTQALEEVKVKITAKLVYKEIILTKPFSLIIASNKPAKVEVSDITIAADKTEIEVDEELTLTATIVPENAEVKDITWSTSDAFVATVDKDGKVTGISAGEVTITATSDDNTDIFASVKLTVIEPLPISTIANVLSQVEVVETKVMATVVGKYAQGYMLYDETGFIIYYLGKDAALSYEIGDYLEIVGKVEEYNGRYQFTKTAKSSKLTASTPYSFDYYSFTAEQLAEYMNNVNFAQPVEFQAICTKASGNYAEFTIKGTTYGLTIAYPMDINAYTAGVEYLVQGFVLYAKEYQSVNSLYVMEINTAALHSVKFNTGVETLTVDDIVFTDCNEVLLPEIYREGYYFMGWKDGETTVEALTENKDYVLTADWVERNFEAVDFELNGGDFLFDNQFFINNYNSFVGKLKYYDCFTIYKKGSTSVAWASQYYLKFFMKEVEPGSNIYKLVYKAGSSVAVEGDLLAGVTYDYDYIISSNATNKEGHPWFSDLYDDENLEKYYWYFVVPENTPSKCNIKVVFNLEKAKVDSSALKYEADEALPDAEKPNYDFLGWYNNAEFTGDPISTHVSGTTKYYAKYEATTYTVTFDLGEGACSESLPTTYTVLSEAIALPTEDKMSKEGHIFMGWYDNNEGKGTKYTEIAQGTGTDLTLYAVWQSTSATQKQLDANDVAILNAINATKFVLADAKLSPYSFVGEGLNAKYNDIAAEQIFLNLGDALAVATEGETIYVFAGEYTVTEAVTVNNITVVGPNANIIGSGQRVEEAKIIITPGVLTVYGTWKFSGVKITTNNSTSGSDIFTADANTEKLILENVYVLNIKNFSYAEAGNPSFEYIGCYFDGVTQFIIWVEVANEVLVDNCNFNMSTCGTVGAESYKTALFRVRGGKLTFVNNYVEGATAFYLIEIKNGSGFVGYNTFKNNAIKLYLSAAGNIVANNNLYLDYTGAAVTASTLVETKKDGASGALTVDTAVYASEDERLAGYNQYVADQNKVFLDKVAAIAADFMTDYNAKNSVTKTAAELDSETSESSYLVAMMQDETLKAKWMWLYKALYTAAQGAEACNPEAATQNFSDYAVKGFYLINLNGFFTGTQHTDKAFGTSADWTNIELVKQVLNAKPAN